MFICRYHVYIKRKEKRVQKSPDALVVMANPGIINQRILHTSKVPVAKTNFTKIPYVLVNVALKQYQLMRLMKLRKKKTEVSEQSCYKESFDFIRREND